VRTSTEDLNWYINLFACQYLSNGVYSTSKKLRIIYNFLAPDYILDINLAMHYNASFNTLMENQFNSKIMLRMKGVNIVTGQATPNYDLFVNSPLS